MNTTIASAQYDPSAARALLAQRCINASPMYLPPVRPALSEAPPPNREVALDDPRLNHLLAALPLAAWLSLRPHLEPVALPLGTVLHEPGSHLTHAWFPTSAIVSIQHLTQDGATAESALVGHDGLVGSALLLGSDRANTRAVVLSAGRGLRIAAHRLQSECACCAPTQALMLRYVQSLFTQVAQTAVCNRHHSLEQQLCRCLLRHLDLSPTDDLLMTHELIASTLGVRREGVTEAAGRLDRAGLIRYRRGHITVLDRDGLEQRSCECYAVTQREQSRLLPQPLPPLSPVPLAA